VNLGFDPTINAEFDSIRSRLEIDQKHNLFDKPVKNIAVYSPLELRIVHCPSEKFVKYAQSKFGYMSRSSYINFDPYCLYLKIPIIIEKDTDDEITYKIEDEEITSSLEEFKTNVEQLIEVTEEKAKKKRYEKLAKNKKESGLVDKNKKKKEVITKLIDRFQNMFEGKNNEEFIQTFNKCWDINPEALDILVSEKAAYDVLESAQEYDDNCSWDSYDIYTKLFTWSFLENLNKDWDGKFDTFCEEYDITNLDKLQEWYEECGEHEFPTEKDVKIGA
jgi:hypothetical protein